MQKEGDVNKKTSQKLRAMVSTDKLSTSDTENDINSLIRELWRLSERYTELT